MNTSRRTLLSGALGGASLLALDGTPALAGHQAPGNRAPGHIRTRATLPSGVQSGDVTTDSAVLWSRCDRPGRMVVELSRGGRRRHRELVRGPQATPAGDNTAKVELSGLRPGTDYEYRVHFETEHGTRSEVGVGHFSTAHPGHQPTRFVWTGDTAGQGYGINPDLGGMVAYRAMLDVEPEFLVHSGDNIYADGPIPETLVEPDGQLWRNITTPQTLKVAETLDEFRGRYRYNLMDDNYRAMYAEVPVLSQWDDHETHNNWFPGQVLTDDRYTERRVDVLAARGRQAFFEYMPLGRRHGLGDSDFGKDPSVYRVVRRGGHCDVFCLDERTWRDANDANNQPTRRAFMGAKQVEWLLRELQRSRATWKVIASDMPIGIVVPDGANFEALANADNGAPLGRELEMAYLLREIKRRNIRNVVWITADVHYAAAFRYDPAHAAFGDFNAFHEFVTGPISAGGFGPNKMDATFGPQTLFQQTPPFQSMSPRNQKHMYFGQVDIAHDGELTVQIRNGLGEVQYTQTLEPQHR